MNHDSDPTPPQPELTPGASTPPASPARSWFARYGLVVISAAGALVAAGVAAAAVPFLAQPDPSIEKMVPATPDVLVIANPHPARAPQGHPRRAVPSCPQTPTA